MIYTSYYAGKILGEAVSISLYPPKGWTGKHLPLFAPTPELLHWWKGSAKDAATQQEYKRQFYEILQSRQQLIQLWVNRHKDNPQDITLCCYEKPTDFCHRHQVGEEVVQNYLPELWGGEVGLSADVHINKGNGFTDTPGITSTSSKQYHNSSVTPKQLTPIDSTYPATVQSVLAKCYDAGVPVVCLRLACGYYRVSLHGEDLGDWSELGVLGVLSLLQQEFYRGRLVESG
ncbi:hypothetical protein A6770_28250 [Nostoc minutum NIES-26]|uniref:DUF488 domain-containing protein n=1 Tax=Nostoc minutum NIES-26 TaxID=1844469 RepID=A0A367QMH4_9NOSO|nr:hypothetical protein A6770_28250 [Nostoc minutum NIES-26]